MLDLRSLNLHLFVSSWPSLLFVTPRTTPPGHVPSVLRFLDPHHPGLTHFDPAPPGFAPPTGHLDSRSPEPALTVPTLPHFASLTAWNSINKLACLNAYRKARDLAKRDCFQWPRGIHPKKIKYRDKKTTGYWDIDRNSSLLYGLLVYRPLNTNYRVF